MIFSASNKLHKNVVCFTTSTLNGVSSKPYESFNVGDHVGDCADAVVENRKRLNNIICQEIVQKKEVDYSCINPIRWLTQQHTNHHEYYENISPNLPCDSVSTRQIFTPLVIMTADCMPIVLSSDSGQISAIHAGWKGLLLDIIENVVSEYKDTSSIRAWIGPSISMKNFEITSELLPKFKQYSTYVEHVKDSQYRVDLVGIAKKKLLDLGVVNVEHSNICTYENLNCFSHRRATHQGMSNTGRMATVALLVK